LVRIVDHKISAKVETRGIFSLPKSIAAASRIFLGAQAAVPKVARMQNADTLPQMEIPGLAAWERGPGGFARLTITSPLAEAHIYLHGAHVTHFQPSGDAPLLFLSARSQFSPGKPIRGGIPICFPWFGPRAGHPESPMHGFARTTAWKIKSLTADASGTVTAVFVLEASDVTRALWPHDFRIRHIVTVARTLTTALEVTNPSSAPFQFEEALHTYLAVADVRETSVTGLEICAFIDKTDALAVKTNAAAPMRFTGETDRIFENTRATCVAHDAAGGRRLRIEKSGSETTVVWNPWIAKAVAMADFGDDEWPAMLCIETANAGANAITLAPGASHTMRAVISAD
jgi:D-hexose-6-phosphate mutarotase